MNKIEITLGALFVVMSACERFNTPVANRSTTTAVRYYTAVFMYLAIACMTFFVLMNYPELLKLVGTDVIPKAVMDLPGPLMAALVLTVLLDKMPFFAPLDRWLRQKLQYIANIPFEARRMSHHLQRAEFVVAEDVKSRVREKVLGAGFRLDDIQFDRIEAPQYTWTKIAVLIDHLDAWQGRRMFSGFLAESADEFKGLLQRYEQLSKKALRCLNHLRDLPHDGSDPKSAEIGDAYKGVLKEQAEELLGNLCDFASRGILQCSVKHDTRRQELRSLGFREEVMIDRSPLSFHQFVSLFAVTATVLLFGTVFASRHAGGTFGLKLGIVVMVATIYSFAIVCALFPKDQWAIARRGEHGERPTGFYLIAGLLAAFSSVAVNFVFKVILIGWTDAVNDLAFSYPWLLCSFATAVSTAYLTDNRGDEFAHRQRWVEGGLQALSMMVASYLTYLWLASVGYFEFRHTNPSQFLPYLMGLSAVNGFALGFLVPTWYRKSRHSGTANGNDLPTLVGTGPA